MPDIFALRDQARMADTRNKIIRPEIDQQYAMVRDAEETIETAESWVERNLGGNVALRRWMGRWAVTND